MKKIFILFVSTLLQVWINYLPAHGHVLLAVRVFRRKVEELLLGGLLLATSAILSTSCTSRTGGRTSRRRSRASRLG